MICGNCGTNVDNDLIFCTNCGVRLNETWNNSSPETGRAPIEKPPENSSNLKWLAVIVALVAVPVSLVFGYLFLKTDTPQTVTNANKPANASPTKKPVNKSVNTANSANANANAANSNSTVTNANSTIPPKTNEIKIERLEIAPDTHTAYPFEVKTETAKILGKIEVLQGAQLVGYVYTQQAYDEHFPDPLHKMFSFDGNKTIDIEQTLIEGKYVLVVINETEKSIVIEGNFKIE